TCTWRPLSAALLAARACSSQLASSPWLQTAAAAARERVVVGITVGRMLQSKELCELIQPFEQRQQAVTQFLQVRFLVPLASAPRFHLPASSHACLLSRMSSISFPLVLTHPPVPLPPNPSSFAVSHLSLMDSLPPHAALPHACAVLHGVAMGGGARGHGAGGEGGSEGGGSGDRGPLRPRHHRPSHGRHRCQVLCSHLNPFLTSRM
ncbi:unnamed protein product, partial [Closterium sp. NIES-53]